VNNPKQDAKLHELIDTVRREVASALAQRAELDETIARGRAMLQALMTVRDA
jgi:hypothetical protein